MVVMKCRIFNPCRDGKLRQMFRVSFATKNSEVFSGNPAGVNFFSFFLKFFLFCLVLRFELSFNKTNVLSKNVQMKKQGDKKGNADLVTRCCCCGNMSHGGRQFSVAFEFACVSPSLETRETRSRRHFYLLAFVLMLDYTKKKKRVLCFVRT